MIVSTPDVLHGQPRIRETRMPVWVVLSALSRGEGIDNICREYRITRDDIAACLEFASTKVRRPFHPKRKSSKPPASSYTDPGGST